MEFSFSWKSAQELQAKSEVQLQSKKTCGIHHQGAAGFSFKSAFARSFPFRFTRKRTNRSLTSLGKGILLHEFKPQMDQIFMLSFQNSLQMVMFTRRLYYLIKTENFLLYTLIHVHSGTLWAHMFLWEYLQCVLVTVQLLSAHGYCILPIHVYGTGIYCIL